MKKNITEEQLSGYKFTHKSGEFITTIIMIFSLLFELRYEINGLLWGSSISLVISSYMISRAFFKKNRRIFRYGSEYTTEFYFYLVGNAMILLGLYLQKISLSQSIIFLAIIQCAFNLSRGYTKSMGGGTSSVHVINP